MGSWTFKYHQKDRPGTSMYPSDDKPLLTLNDQTKKFPWHSDCCVWVLCNYTSTTCVCVVQPRLDLVNMVVKPLLFTKSRLFTKSILDKEWNMKKRSWSLFIKSSISLNWGSLNRGSLNWDLVVCVDGLWKLEEKKNGVVDRYLSNHHDDDKHVLCCSLYIGTSWFYNWSEQKLWRR